MNEKELITELFDIIYLILSIKKLFIKFFLFILAQSSSIFYIVILLGNRLVLIFFNIYF